MESYEVVKYETSGFFGDHYDWYDDSPGGKRQLGQEGNRVATALMYLNTPDGGGTYFPNLDITVPAVKGSMVVFKFPNCEESTLHRGCDVHSGEKWIATKFVRTNDYVAS
jgi:prolyl 4-hydroxylase